MAGLTACDDHVGRNCAYSSPSKSPAVLLTAVVLGSSMAFIDSTVVNVAVPAIQKNLGASLAAMQWIVNGYTLVLGAFIIIGGSLGDHLGRRKIFLAGVILFAAASLLCGFAPTTVILIAARVIQGLGGAMLIPGSLAIISSSFPENERGKAIGVWAAGSALSAAVGPILGGLLVDHVSWRSVFFINIPIAVCVVFLSFAGIPESRDKVSHPIDWFSGALAALSLGGISFGLIEGPERGWSSAEVLVAIAIGVILLCIFVWRQFKARNPMMPPDLFKSRTFSGVNVMTLLLYGALSGALFFLPFNLIQVRGYSAAAAGASFLPFAILMGGFSRWAGGLVNRFGTKLPLIVGPLVVSAGFLALAFAGSANYWLSIFPGVFLLGAGMTITVAPLTTAVMGSIPQEQAGIGSGINNAVSRIAGLLAVAALGAVVTGIYAKDLIGRSASLSLQDRQQIASTVHELLAAPVPKDLSADQSNDLKKSRVEAFLKGYQLAFMIAAGLAVLSAGVAAATVVPVKKPAKKPST